MSVNQSTPCRLMPRLTWIVAAACLAALPACEQAGTLAAAPDPAAGNELGGLSLALSANTPTFGNRLHDPAALTVVVRNALPQPAFVPALRVVQGHQHLEGCSGGGAPYEKNHLRYARGLTYLFRFSDGTAVPADNTYPGETPGGTCSDGRNWEYGPLEVPADGEKGLTQQLLHTFSYAPGELADAFYRCKSFCVVAVAEGAGLHSNAVFFNGKFALPAGFDPVAEVRAQRKAKADALEAGRARDDAEIQRRMREAGAPP